MWGEGAKDRTPLPNQPASIFEERGKTEGDRLSEKGKVTIHNSKRVIVSQWLAMLTPLIP